MALLWKMICNIGDPMSLGHPLSISPDRGPAISRTSQRRSHRFVYIYIYIQTHIHTHTHRHTQRHTHTWWDTHTHDECCCHHHLSYLQSRGPDKARNACVRAVIYVGRESCMCATRRDMHEVDSDVCVVYVPTQLWVLLHVCYTSRHASVRAQLSVLLHGCDMGVMQDSHVPYVCVWYCTGMSPAALLLQLSVLLHACARTHICRYTLMCIYIYICIHIYHHICIYIYIIIYV